MTLIGGFNVHNKIGVQHEWSAQDKKDHLALLDELQPSAMLYLDNLDMARQVKKLLPNCHVIHRQFFEFDLGGNEKFTEGSIWKYETFQNKNTQDWLYERIARDGEGGIIVHVLNEPSGYGTHLPKLVGWLVPMLERLAKAGIACGGPNWGVGQPDENRFDELALLLALCVNPKYKDLIKYLIHEYWAWDGINYGNGRVGRFEWLAGYLAKAGRPVPDMIVTEFGIDDKLDGTNKRGWKDAGISEEEYAAQGEAVRARYEKWKCIKGFTWFVKGRTSIDWETHDTQGCKTFDAALVKRSKELRQGTPVPPPLPPVPPPPPIPSFPQPVPKPIDPGIGVLVKINKTGILNLRDGPDEKYRKIGEMKANERITIYRGTIQLDPDTPLQHWYWVETLDGKCGWAADVNGIVKFEEVYSPHESLMLTTLKVIAADYSEMIALLQSKQRFVNQVIEQIERITS